MFVFHHLIVCVTVSLCYLATAVEGAAANGIRLAGGILSNEGRVEVFYNGAWGTVCDNGWSEENAKVVCRQLGYPTDDATAYSYTQFEEEPEGTWLDDVEFSGNENSGSEYKPVWLKNVRCTGIEGSLSRCLHSGWREHSCGQYDVAGAACANDIRLAGGRFPNEGRVEVLYNGTWGTVCDDSWDANDAKVVCRQLGLPTAGATAYDKAHFMQGAGNVLLGAVFCTGKENALGRCLHSGWGNNYCSHSEDASVACDYPIRLTHGQLPSEGRVEVYHNGVWGTICDNGWGEKDARVVCRQLGFPTENPTAYRSAHFGDGVGDIWLDKVKCTGKETSLSRCSHAGWVKNNCDHSKDAGVVCGMSVCIRYSECCEIGTWLRKTGPTVLVKICKAYSNELSTRTNVKYNLYYGNCTISFLSE